MRVAVFVSLALAVLAIAGFAATRTTPTSGASAREIRRVQAHLRGAERVLEARSLSSLTPDQRAARSRLLADLRLYRRRGVFPKNLDFPERRPYFIDAVGTRCAMAHLIERHGGAAMVARIARQRNNAYVRELADDPQLAAWLDRNGITAAEAARIQPQYDPRPFNDYVAGGRRDDTVLLGLTLWTETVGILANTRRADTPGKRAAGALFGGLAALVGVGTGFSQIDNAQGSRAWGAACLGLAGLSLGLAIRQAAPAPPEKHEPIIIEAGLWRSRDGAPGLAMRARF
jgi:hypothetical protein